MPELPEVETIVRDLRTRIPGRTIRKVSVTRPDILAAGTPASFQRRLRGRRIETVERRAKSIVLHLDDLSTLAVSLGMTGRLVAAEAQRAAELRHVAVRFDLDDGRALLYDDARRFGRLQHYPPGDWQQREREFGLEPLTEGFTPAALFELTRRSRSPIRNWLLDPYRVAGVGNIYANEALYRARVRPTRRANRITRAESALLRDALRSVLQEAIDRRGTTLNNYRDANGEEGEYYAQLQVYGRDGEPCVRCGSRIKRIVLSNRSAFYCPQCQR
jgi:formamidopyrimidine-DNA glycosylase